MLNAYDDISWDDRLYGSHDDDEDEDDAPWPDEPNEETGE